MSMQTQNTIFTECMHLSVFFPRGGILWKLDTKNILIHGNKTTNSFTPGGIDLSNSKGMLLMNITSNLDKNISCIPSHN